MKFYQIPKTEKKYKFIYLRKSGENLRPEANPEKINPELKLNNLADNITAKHRADTVKAFAGERGKLLEKFLTKAEVKEAKKQIAKTGKLPKNSPVAKARKTQETAQIPAQEAPKFFQKIANFAKNILGQRGENPEISKKLATTRELAEAKGFGPIQVNQNA